MCLERQRSFKNINDPIRTVKTEIIVADAVCDETSDDFECFHVENTVSDYFAYSLDFFCVFRHSRRLNVKHEGG